MANPEEDPSKQNTEGDAADEETLPTMDETLVNPLDEKEEAQAYESDVLKTVVDTETSEGAEQILEAAPEVDTSLLEDIAPTKSLTLTALKIAFGILMAFSIASIIFFTSQLTDKMDFAISTFGVSNASAELAATNDEVLDLQTSLNFYRYLQYKAFLDQFSYYGDSFVQYYDIANSQTASTSDKAEAKEEMQKLREQLRQAFLFAGEYASAQFTVPLIDPEIEDLDQVFVEALKGRIADTVAEYKALQPTETDEAAVSEDEIATEEPALQSEQKNYLQMLKLVGNDPLHTLIVNTDFDVLTDAELYDLIKTVNTLIVNDLSIIQEIKNNRVRWSDVMNELELRTIAVDRNYTEDFYDQIGGIQYTSYEFDSENQRITIVGETKRFDTTNFTMIANLIDSLNSSRLFGNAEMRTFSKSGSLDAGYVANLRLTLDLDKDLVTDLSKRLIDLAIQNGEEVEEELGEDVVEEEVIIEGESLAEDEEAVEGEIEEDVDIEEELEEFEVGEVEEVPEEAVIEEEPVEEVVEETVEE